MILPQPVACCGTGVSNGEAESLARLSAERVFMMGDNPARARMPERPTLLDFFRLRFGGISARLRLSQASICGWLPCSSANRLSAVPPRVAASSGADCRVLH